MKSLRTIIPVVCFFMATCALGQVTFVQQPSMISSGANQWTITFEVSQATDVEVSIVNTQDSTVVRHLAAGLLGAKAPLPFAVNALSQSLTWDGKDDFGKLAENLENISVRVRAGLTPTLVGFAGENLYDNPGSPSIATSGTGSVYILSNVNSQCPALRKYDASGNYIKTLYPPPTNLPADSVKSYGLNLLPDGSWVPKTYQYVEHAVIFTSLVLRNATISYWANKIKVISGTSGMHIIDTNGCFTDTAPNAMVLDRAVVKPVIPGVTADLIGKSVRTGAFYAITNNLTHPSLAKYSVSNAVSSLAASVTLSSSESGPADSITSVAVTESGSATNIFVGFKNSGIRIYSDNGTGPKLMKALASGFRDGPYVFERVAVDRNSDCVYWNGSNVISDWSNPIAKNFQMDRLDNITIGPDGRFLYGWDGDTWNGIANVRRFSRKNYSPVPYGSTGSNCATGGIYFQYGAAGTPGNHRGIALGWQGQIAAFTEGSYLIQVPDTNGSVTCGNWDAAPVGDCRKLLSATAPKEGARQNMMGVKYDPAGNYYVGLRKISKPIVPAGFGLDRAFHNIGAVVKFRPESTAVYYPSTMVLTGYDKIYPQPYGPFSAPATGPDPIVGGSADCTCRNSYFDVDPYGRIYVPNGVTCQVYMADNAGNNIAVFGKYGNTDSRGGTWGPGELLPSSGIPMAWPTSVAASEDFIYVGDLVNARLVRVQMVYAIDNIPGLTLHGIDAIDKGSAIYKSPLRLSAAPNPFCAVSRITFSLPVASPIELTVYDINGRKVKTLANGNFRSGTHLFSWDAKNMAGKAMAAGVYVYRLTAGKHVLTQRAIFTR